MTDEDKIVILATIVTDEGDILRLDNDGALTVGDSAGAIAQVYLSVANALKLSDALDEITEPRS